MGYVSLNNWFVKIISAISFVGGNQAGEHIFDRGTKAGKRVQANLGMVMIVWYDDIILIL